MYLCVFLSASMTLLDPWTARRHSQGRRKSPLTVQRSCMAKTLGLVGIQRAPRRDNRHATPRRLRDTRAPLRFVLHLGAGRPDDRAPCAAEGDCQSNIKRPSGDPSDRFKPGIIRGERG